MDLLSHLEQRPLHSIPKSNSKDQLLDEIENVIDNESNPANEYKSFIEIFIRKFDVFHERTEKPLSDNGWTIDDDGSLKPVNFIVNTATENIPLDIEEVIKKASDRFSQSDFSGAITSICNAVEILTSQIYELREFSDFNHDSFQTKVTKSFSSFEDKLKNSLTEDRLFSDSHQVNIIWNNYKSSINQAAEVLRNIRNNFGDVHNNSSSTSKIARYAMDCGMFILRSISALLN